MPNLDQIIALVLSGGNALGAYSAGAYEALQRRGYLPDIVSGASVGAVTGGIIAGNVPEQRIAKLRELWNQASLGSAPGPAPAGGKSREVYNTAHALQTLMMGRPGLFMPRLPGILSMLPGMPPDVALFDNKPLVATLQRAIDFDLLNSAALPLLVTAVDLRSSDAVVLDTRQAPLHPAHFLASTAFSPAFPPVEIDGRCLGDPGLISNLPLDAVLDPPSERDVLCFAVDLFNPHGQIPRSLDTSIERAQDIVFSAQSTRTIDARGREHRLRRAIRELVAALPGEALADERIAALAADARQHDVTVVHIGYRAPPHELAAKTLEFSRASTEERWASGLRDMDAALDRLEAGRATFADRGFTLYDTRHGHRSD